MTVKIVTSHDEVHQCMCNLGCNLTVGGVPSQSKQAFIQRTTCLFARDQTCNKDGSDNKEFEAKLKEPVVAERIAKFRLFVSMVSFVRMAIKNVEWLHPDTAYAKVLWREWDAMLTDDFGMPRPQPRRQAKRMENLITMTVMEAVARVYLFKQSAAQFEEGRPEGFDDEGNPKLPSFEPGHLWAVLRTLVPSREVIYSAWSQGLEYTVGTSMHGVNVMTAMCQKVGISMTQCLKLNPTEDTSALLTKAEDVTYTCADLMGSADGRPTSEIETLARTLSRAREQRSAFRRMSDHQPGVAPAEAIRRVVEQKNSQLPDIDKIDATDVTNALYPTFAHAALYYKPQALIKWCNSKPFGGGTDLAPFFDTDPVTGSIRLHRFHARQSLAGESKVFDPAWIVVDSGISDERLLYAKAARTLMNGDSPCSTLGMHEEGVADTIMQLSTTENNQMCPEMPTMPSEMMPSRMFDDVSASTSDAPAPDRLGLREHSVDAADARCGGKEGRRRGRQRGRGPAVLVAPVQRAAHTPGARPPCRPRTSPCAAAGHLDQVQGGPSRTHRGRRAGDQLGPRVRARDDGHRGGPRAADAPGREELSGDARSERSRADGHHDARSNVARQRRGGSHDAALVLVRPHADLLHLEGGRDAAHERAGRGAAHVQRRHVGALSRRGCQSAHRARRPAAHDDAVPGLPEVREQQHARRSIERDHQAALAPCS